MVGWKKVEEERSGVEKFTMENGTQTLKINTDVEAFVCQNKGLTQRIENFVNNMGLGYVKFNEKTIKQMAKPFSSGSK